MIMSLDGGARAGPSGRAPWSRVEVHDVPLLALPGVGAEGGGVHYVVRARPAVLEGAGREPRFSLVVLLDRPPRADEEDVTPLVRGGQLAVELAAGAAPAVRREYERLNGVRCEPLFVREAHAELRQGGARAREEPIASQTGSGISATFALGATLDRDATLDVLRALDGRGTSLVVHTTLAFRVADRARCEEGASGTIHTAEMESPLEDVLGGLLAGRDRDRFVRFVAPGPGNGGERSTRRVRGAAVRAEPDDGSTRLSAVGDRVSSLALAMRPAPNRPSAAVLASSDIVKPTLAYTASGRLVHHWALDDLVLDDGLARPARLPVVDDASAAVWRDRVDAKTYWYAPAYELVMPQGSDTMDTSPFLFRFWRVGASSAGAPVLRAVVRFTLRPAMSAATRAALQQLGGVTAKPVPAGDVAVSLVVPYVDATDGSARTTTLRASTAHAGDDLVATVELLDPVVRCCYGALAVPGFQATPARLTVTYSYECYVPVKPGKLQVVAGGKRSYIPLVSSAEESAAMGDEPHFDASTATFRSRGGEVRLAREGQPGSSSIRRPGGAVAAVQPLHVAHAAVAAATAVGNGSATVPATHAVTPAMLTAGAAVATPVTVTRPPAALASVLASLLQRVEYARRTLVREDRLDALVPCSGLGALYVEGEDATARAVGCVDALRLGEASLRLYDEIPELAHASYRVFRALQQPGRFLVLPARYRITRFDRSVPAKAYRPAVCMYAAIDATTPSNNRIVYHATLEPDVAPHLRRALRDSLSSEARDPIISYPTELPVAAQYEWTVGSLVQVQPEVVRAPDHFQVSLATDVAGALLLRSMLQTGGVYGQARFALGDGSTLQTVLALELTQIIGPWSTGPVEVALSGASAQLTNRVERALDVSDLEVFRAGGSERVPVESRLASGETRTVALSAPATDAYAVAAAPADVPVTLEEIRSFVEDVHTNVIFIDLTDHATHGLRALAVQARLADVPGTSDVVLAGDPPRGALELLLPLTTYLERTVLQFAVRMSFTSGPDRTTPWIDWDLARAGNVISLTWELIGS